MARCREWEKGQGKNGTISHDAINWDKESNK